MSNINKSIFKEDLSELLEKDFSKKKILLYAREAKLSGLLFREYGDIIARKYLNGNNYDILADMVSPRDFILETDKYSYADYTVEDWKIFREVLDTNTIIRNDRAFRHSIPYYEACEMIYSSAKFILEFLKKNKYDIIITNMMDFYVTDILVRIAEYLNIPIISYCVNSFGLDAIMITKRGEPVYIKEPTETEVESLYQLLIKKNNPFVLSKSKAYKMAFSNFIKYKVKYLYHHIFLYKLLKKTDYIYKVSGSGTYVRSIGSFFSQYKYFISDLTKLKGLDVKKTVYIPLHYYPEATTDYWIRCKDYTTYYPSLFETIKKYTERGFNVLIKEHTAMFLYRNTNFYAQIKSLEKVYFISPFISSYEMFKSAEYVVVWTGTTGIEAIIQNKKVILAYDDPYYGFGKLVQIGNEHKAKIFNEEEKREMLKNILCSYLPVNKI